MDTLRGNFGALDTADLGPGFDAPEDEHDSTVDDSPPPAIGTDERRMQVRAYNFWASLLDERNFPAIEDLDPDALPDFGPNSVLLDFSRGLENPEVAYLGHRLAEECDTSETDISQLTDVPARSLLSRITDHYMQIIANQAPIGFEAEFVNQRGATILYRGILLPFSSDDESIDFIYGVINWKEMADSGVSDELLLEMDQAVDLDGDDVVLEEPRRQVQDEMVDWADGPSVPAASRVDIPEPAFGQGADAPADPADMELADWLAAAREMAQTAQNSEERTRSSLYEAVSRAYDFAVAALDAPEDFAELLSDSGLTMQERAPMTPVVKLVFGVDYDKTRLTEYAAVLSWARRTGVERGALGDHLKTAEGGLKGVIAAERAYRREQDGKPAAPKPRGPKKSVVRKLRAMEPRRLESLGGEGEEFGLVMIRRSETGEVLVLGEVPANAALIEKAARELLD
ncbi:PAS domain-containing protein [Aurantiacibacter hainanensis]|uniref:PAS domain-containing protein n=1 Tax=Aurantiacibacter hainanensis TaxID=3076114 RepID=UPI0030C681FF